MSVAKIITHFLRTVDEHEVRMDEIRSALADDRAPFKVNERVTVQERVDTFDAVVWRDCGSDGVEVLIRAENGVRLGPILFAREYVARVKEGWGWRERAERAETALYAMHRRSHRAGECSFCRAFTTGTISEGY